jgi:hypothetical protein
MASTVVEGGKGTVELRSDGLIYLVWKTDVNLEVQGTRRVLDDRRLQS